MSRRDALLAIALALSAASARCAELRGRVTDADAAPLPLAAVSLANARRGALSDSLGAFRIADLAPGRYTVVASAVGFLPDTQRVSLATGAALVTFRLLPSPVVLPPVVVSGSRVEVAERTTAFVATFRPERIAEPSATVAELLDETVGVQVRSMGGHGSFSTLSIRGSTAEQVRIYLDGVPLNQAVGGGVNLATIPLSTVESVEVYRGVIPPEFGGSGLAGVVNLRTRAASDSLRWKAGVAYGSWATRMAHGWLGRRIGPVAGLVSADYSASGNGFRYLDDNGTSYNPADDVWARRRNNEFSSVELLARLASRPASAYHWAASYEFLDITNHLPGNSTLHELPSNARTRGQQHLAEASVARSLPLLSEATLQVYHSRRRDRFTDEQGMVGLGRKKTDDLGRVWGGRLSLATSLLPAQRVALDASAQRDAFDPNDLLITDAATRERYLQPSRRRQVAAYLSDEVSLLDRRLVLTGQIGHQRVANDVVREILYGQPVQRDTSGATAWPRALGLSAEILPWLRLQANWGRYLRVPNLYELFGDRGSTIGNGNLRPERGTNRDVGVRLAGSAGTRRAEAELVYFDNRIADMILFWEAYNRMKPFNMGAAHLQGIEASGTVAGPRFSCAAGLTWQRPRNTSSMGDSMYYGNDLPHRPRVQADVRPEVVLGRATLFYALHVHNGYYGQPLNRLADRIPAAWVHDAGARVRVSRWLVLSAEGRNLSDIREFTSRYVPLPGRSWIASALATPL